MEPTYSAVSLDLWFTLISYAPGDENAWSDARVEYLRHVVRDRNGSSLTAGTIQAGMDRANEQLARSGHGPATVAPQRLIPLYLEALSGVLAVPHDAAVRGFASAGLADHPPVINPDAVALVHGLAGRGIPVAVVSNTARDAATWRAFLRPRGLSGVSEIVTSCETGHAKPHPEIFREAARRLGVAPSDVLHVGDRWELDVEGALAAGCGARLYRGLWDQYPEGLYPPDGAARPVPVAVLDRLDSLLTDPTVGRTGRTPPVDREGPAGREHK